MKWVCLNKQPKAWFLDSFSTTNQDLICWLLITKLYDAHLIIHAFNYCYYLYLYFYMSLREYYSSFLLGCWLNIEYFDLIGFTLIEITKVYTPYKKKQELDNIDNITFTDCHLITPLLPILQYPLYDNLLLFELNLRLLVI